MISFNEETHKYTLNGRELISVTQLMKKHGLSPNYIGVSEEVLRAKAERGTLIHKEIEDFNKNGVIGFTEEVQQFVDYIQENKIRVQASELIVYNDIVAGTLDLILADKNRTIIADIKTTSTLHKEAVSWQLSIYAYLLGTKIDGGQAFHFDNEGNLKVVDIPLKPTKEVEKLMFAEEKGELYQLPLVKLDDEQLEIVQQAQEIIIQADRMKKEAEARMEVIKDAIINAMIETGTKTFENDIMKITLVEGYEKVSIDTTRFKKENPKLAEKYNKTTQVKASLKITLKEGK